MILLAKEEQIKHVYHIDIEGTIEIKAFSEDEAWEIYDEMTVEEIICYTGVTITDIGEEC